MSNPHKGKKKKPPFVMLRNNVFESKAYRVLPPPERAVLWEIIRRHNNRNNGHIALSVREAAERCNIGKTTAQRALRTLQVFGFIKCTKNSAFSYKTKQSRRWALTWEAELGKDLQPKAAPTNEWMEFSQQLESNGAENALGSQEDTSPRCAVV